jgi:Sec7-like guanine-nucleotide exchange factor
MGRFDFEHQPLDIALRQLLMHMSLPKETQQIDRVMEAFAARYEECEPRLFKQHGRSCPLRNQGVVAGLALSYSDNTYVLAFSMMMLHTDAFNKHNKNKMSKADYVRNTRLDGVSSLVLEVSDQ